MVNEDTYSRRASDWPALEHRVESLEQWRQEQRQEHAHHDIILDKLLVQDAEMVTAIKVIAESFKSFKNMFRVGFQIISVCTVVVVGIIGAFWSYSHDLDQKYAPKFDQLVNNTEAQKQATISNSARLNEIRSTTIEAKADIAEKDQTIQQQINKLESLKTDIEKIQNLKVIQASKPGRNK